MNTMIALSHLFADPILGALQGIVLGLGSDIGTKLVTTVRVIVGPIVLLAVGLVALTYLMRRQVTQFLQFIALAILIGVFFYTNALLALVNFVAGLFEGSTV